MPDQDKIETPDIIEGTPDNSGKDPTKPEVNLDDIVTKRVADELAKIKENLDKAYALRDEALNKVKEFEKKQRDEEIKRLQDEGKHREAYEIQLREEREARLKAEESIVQLTRDNQLRSVLAAHAFRNKNASEMAYKEIVSELVKDDKGQWQHKSGISVEEYVSAFAELPDNAFLFTQKVSTGSGGKPLKSSAPTTKSTSLFAMSQAEVLKLAEEGKLRKPS